MIGQLIRFTHAFKVFNNIFEIILELKPKNGFKYPKTGFDY